MKSYKNDFDELKKIPKTSGIYYFYGENDNVLYIGKANILHSRIFAHFHEHSLFRQIGFFVKMIESKGFSVKDKENLPKELLNIWDDLCEKDWSSSPIVIDWVFDKVKRIEIEEMPKELTKEKEKKLILKFQPIYNSESNSIEYNEIKYG